MHIGRKAFQTWGLFTQTQNPAHIANGVIHPQVNCAGKSI